MGKIRPVLKAWEQQGFLSSLLPGSKCSKAELIPRICMWRIVEHKYKPEVYRSGHTYQRNKLTEKSLEQGDTNGLILLPSLLSRMEICYWEYVHIFRVGCPQLSLDTKSAHLLAPGHTMPNSGCWHKCSHTWSKPGLSWLPTITPHPIPVVSLLQIHSPPGSQITTLTWWLIWLDLCWNSHPIYTSAPVIGTMDICVPETWGPAPVSGFDIHPLGLWHLLPPQTHSPSSLWSGCSHIPLTHKHTRGPHTGKE